LFFLSIHNMCACPNPGPGFPTSYVVVVLMFSDLTWEVIVRFIDIGEIVDHHYLNFPFITISAQYRKKNTLHDVMKFVTDLKYLTKLTYSIQWYYCIVYFLLVIFVLVIVNLENKKNIQWSRLLYIYQNPRPAWSWSYGCWIYNCLCNQCISPLTLWVRIPLRWSVLDTTLWDKVCQ
jgi:hypothetical protein